jgi:hypothetical protein
VPAWQNYASVRYYDNGNVTGNLQALRPVRVSSEESAIELTQSTSGNNAATWVIGLKRGRFEVSASLRPLTQANTGGLALLLLLTGASKIAYNSGRVADMALNDTTVPVVSDYGYGCGFAASAANPYIVGLLYQNQPGGLQPQLTGSLNVIASGDTISLSKDSQRAYGFFAIPFGVSGSYSPANLQQEMESVTLTSGFVSAADPGASGGSVARLPSGTAIGAVAQQTTAWGAGVGIFDIWARVRVTSAASATIQLRLGLYNAITGWVAGGYSDYAPSAFPVAYGPSAWVRVATAYTPAAANNHSLRAEGITNAAATDFWVDEMVVVPKRLYLGTTSLQAGPQDVWQQWLHNLEVRMVRG